MQKTLCRIKEKEKNLYSGTSYTNSRKPKTRENLKELREKYTPVEEQGQGLS